VKDPHKSIKYYEEKFGFSLIHQKEFEKHKTTFYFLATLPHGVHPPAKNESEKFFMNFKGTCVGLQHLHGSENNQDLVFNNGNVEPHRGFGHLACSTLDVYKSCEKLEQLGTKFQKRPDDGRMKGLAFVLDENGYWIEVLRRSNAIDFKREFNFSQTMLRVKDPKKSIPFYESLGMKLVNQKDFSDFSLFFLADIPHGTKSPEDVKSSEADEFVKSLFNPILELTWNHGTETKEGPAYHNGNEEPKGFSRLTFLVEDLNDVVKVMKNKGHHFAEGEDVVKSGVIVLDPDNYHVELLQRGSNY